MIQMSGGDMQMSYNQESIYFHGHCIEYDAVDMFQMMVDIALEPRSVLAANVAKYKNEKSHSLADYLSKYDPSMNDSELLLRTAFGYNTLGMPLLGKASNIGNIDARMMQQFIMDNITPRKCLIVASGVKNHEEYVELVKERLSDVLRVPEHEYERKASEYIGGEYRTWSETPATSIQVAFKSVPWNSQDLANFAIMKQLLGHSKGLGGHGRSDSVIRKNAFVDSMGAISSHFTDSGLFGVSIQGAGSHSADLLKLALEQLDGLRNKIDEAELARAKNHFLMDFYSNLENSNDRLEEVARNYMSNQKLTLFDTARAIENVTSSSINAAATKLLAGKPTMVVTGGNINMVPTMTDVQRQLA